jgi:UDP-N-acetylmuramoyl-L-alanyl-D-glutamate--2,6-diaminopimelate ligase
VTLAALLDALPGAVARGPLPGELRGLTDDSRRVEPGAGFVAVTGLRSDGRRHLAEALARGARLVVAEPPDPLPDGPVGRLLVADARAALGRLASAVWGHPSRRLVVVGVTGTNGKTTTTYLVEALLRARGLEPGVVGTIAYRFAGRARDAGQTTPDALALQGLLAEMAAAGVGGVAMEVSSHALAQRRVDGVAFDVAAFTNLTQDHLDFHGTMAAYGEAKARLFREVLPAGGKAGAAAVLNVDDPAGARWAGEVGVPVVTYGLGAGAAIPAVRPRRHASGADGIELQAETPAGPVPLRSPLIGEHNVLNLLGAVAIGVALGLPAGAIGPALGAVGAVPGRFERVDAGQPFLVVVDYAHTPDALRRVLETARRLTPGRLAVVFGAGGDRDRGKRPQMGRLAADLADRVWLTSDNPRSEEPPAIIADIAAGVPAAAAGRCRREPDRRAAIRAAIDWAAAGDTVVIAGKGHETYQVVGAVTLPFDDRAVAREALAGRVGGRACPA